MKIAIINQKFWFFLAPSLKICSRSSPNLAQCVKESIEFLRPRLKTGDFGNGFKIDPLDPLKVENIVIKRGNGFFVNFYNLKGFGAWNFKINKIRVSADPFRIDALVDVPRVDAFGDYNLDMALGILNLKGQGSVKANLGKHSCWLQ